MTVLHGWLTVDELRALEGHPVEPDAPDAAIRIALHRDVLDMPDTAERDTLLRCLDTTTKGRGWTS